MFITMDLKILMILLFLLLTLCNVYLCENAEDKPESSKVSEKLEVIVVGGGLAGMAAARRLIQAGNVNVKVFEARRDRYGGRVWTIRQAAKKIRGIRGVDVELGGFFINTRIRKNPLQQLVKDFNLTTSTVGPVQVYVAEKGEQTKVYSGEDAINLYREAFKLVKTAVKKNKEDKKDRPLIDVIFEEVATSSEIIDNDKMTITQIISSLPTPMCKNFSTHLYDIESEMGWDTIVVDGLDTVIDRIVSGTGMELQIKVQLNKLVRNIEVDNKRKKVLVRTADKLQSVADAVIVTVPIGVLKARDIKFEPALSKHKQLAINNIGIGYSSKVVVGFDEAFWPQDIGSFTILSDIATDGFLQMWINSYRASGNPYLIGNIFGEQVKEWETTDLEVLKDKVKIILGQMFGAEKVKARNMTTFVLSKWSTDSLVQGSVSYPKVGNTPDLWDSLKKPVCPYIYFAGAHTQATGHVDSLQGAYNSGIDAAEQILNKVCKKIKPSNKGGSAKNSKNKNDNDKKKQKGSSPEGKDEL